MQLQDARSSLLISQRVARIGPLVSVVRAGWRLRELTLLATICTESSLGLVRATMVRGPLPTLGGLLAQILDTSAKFPTEHGGADVDILHDDPQHVADIHRKIRSEKQEAQRQARLLHGHQGSPAATMAQSEHCEWLSQPKTIAQPKPTNHVKLLQMRKQREGERHLVAAQLSARREDRATNHVIGRARRRLVREHGNAATTFFEAEDVARGQRIERYAEEQARRAVSAPPRSSSSSSTALVAKDPLHQTKRRGLPPNHSAPAAGTKRSSSGLRAVT